MSEMLLTKPSLLDVLGYGRSVPEFDVDVDFDTSGIADTSGVVDEAMERKYFS